MIGVSVMLHRKLRGCCPGEVGSRAEESQRVCVVITCKNETNENIINELLSTVAQGRGDDLITRLFVPHVLQLDWIGLDWTGLEFILWGL